MTPATLNCPDCGAAMRLRDSTRPGRPKFYSCTRYPACRATHGATSSGRPTGYPADAPTRAARLRAHEAFDAFWQRAGMDRDRAYEYLAELMGLPRQDAHIGTFDQARCEKLIALLEEQERTS